ncbi:unnamed protein product [Rhodiola kirilowii]
MASSTFLKLASVLLICMVAAYPFAAQAVFTCGTVAKSISPCLPYLNAGPPAKPAAGCCSGIKSLLAAASTTAYRQTVCTCLKQAAGGVSGLKPAAASGLPGACGVSIPYPISTSNITCPMSLLGPVSESLDNFQLDIVIRLSPIESPSSRLRVNDDRHTNSSWHLNCQKALNMNASGVDDSLKNVHQSSLQSMGLLLSNNDPVVSGTNSPVKAISRNSQSGGDVTVSRSAEKGCQIPAGRLGQGECSLLLRCLASRSADEASRSAENVLGERDLLRALASRSADEASRSAENVLGH